MIPGRGWGGGCEGPHRHIGLIYFLPTTWMSKIMKLIPEEISKIVKWSRKKIKMSFVCRLPAENRSVKRENL